LRNSQAPGSRVPRDPREAERLSRSHPVALKIGVECGEAHSSTEGCEAFSKTEAWRFRTAQPWKESLMLPSPTRWIIPLSFLLFVMPSTAGADNPAGQYQLDIGASHEIYRIAKDAVDAGDVFPGVECSRRSPGASGKFLFDCEVPYQDFGFDFELAGVVQFLPSNKIEDGVGTSRVKVKIRLEGEMEAEGEEIELSIKETGRGDVDPDFGDADVPMDLRMCVSYEGERVCQSMAFGSVDVLMESIDGTWSLDLDVVSLGGKKLGGTATATFDGLVPTVLDYLIEGSYDLDDDVSKLVLVPQNKKKGNSIVLKKLRVEDGAITGGKVVYDVWGHEGRVKLPLAP
jgi:hypothetical protein